MPDTTIRIPAGFCGIVGLKPTYGRVSRFGCFPEAWTLDHVGPMTRSVKDAAIMLDTISGYDPRDPGSLNLPATTTASSLRTSCEGVTIGVVEEFYFSNVDDEIARCVLSGIDALRERGAQVRTISIPGLKDCEYALTIIDTCETSTVHRAHLRDRPQDYGDEVRLLLECGELPSAVDYLEAQQIRRHLRAEVAAAFAQVDVIAGPTLPDPDADDRAGDCDHQRQGRRRVGEPDPARRPSQPAGAAEPLRPLRARRRHAGGNADHRSRTR